MNRMGRGLSELQKHILRLSLENQQAIRQLDDEDRVPFDVTFSELLVVHYKFPIVGCHWAASLRGKNRAVEKLLRRRYAKFDSHAIGLSRFASAQAALSRAFARLQERGLFSRSCSLWPRQIGGYLTDEGHMVAAALSKIQTHPGGCKLSRATKHHSKGNP
jgi:hypothetical protein